MRVRNPNNKGMFMSGKKRQFDRIFRKTTGRCVCIAADHAGIAGPLQGLVDPEKLVRTCIEGGADCMLTTRGFVQAAEKAWDRQIGIILRISGGFTLLGGRFEEEIISHPRTALLYGANGAAVTVKFGHKKETKFIKQASLTADECFRWQLPLMIEALAFKDGRKIDDPDALALAARVSMEIGADMVKIQYPGIQKNFHLVTEGCQAPILILGGVRENNVETVFTHIHESLAAGGKGVAMGRNIWQHPSPRAMIEAIVGLVHENCTVKQALHHL
jgi:DhnA family fructose-bisphosphate aldolase class Ia